MCGIAGMISYSGASNDAVRAMTRRLQHRGPDAEGLWHEGAAALGHRRLSILDLSDAANQPMVSANGKHVLVFNGEVFNYRELAQELIKKGALSAFRTTSDTEVVLEYLVHEGIAALQRFNGMFALAWWDMEAERLVLVRDRLGIKPLYVAHRGDSLWFASELKSMLVPEVALEKEVNSEALNAYLNVGFVPHPHSIYRSVSSLSPGFFAAFDKKGYSEKPYWDLTAKIRPEVVYREEDALQELNRLLEESVRYRMISDVPFGSFLSGGIDSSLVTAVAQGLSSEPINTFSIAFPEWEKNEGPYAEQVARHLGTRHHAFSVDSAEALQLVPSLIQHYDEPFADSSAIPTLLVSKLAREKVTMVLSGDGGDELFHGYGTHRWAARFNDPTFVLLKPFLRTALKFGNHRQKRVADLLERVSPRYYKSHILSQEQYLFSRKALSPLLRPEWRNNFDLQELGWDLARKLSAAEQQALFDLRCLLPDDLLVKVDRASMAHGLEVRVPLLDYRLVEFAINLSPAMKWKNGSSKYLLKQALYQRLPASLFDRPKWGFSVPMAKWLRGALRPYVFDLLSDGAIQNSRFLLPEGVAPVRNAFFEKGYDPAFTKIWTLLMLRQWELNQG
jgi:asparagine synthase (glutamine-hydrolysing)